jgi:hypothetical protein
MLNAGEWPAESEKTAKTKPPEKALDFDKQKTQSIFPLYQGDN